MFYIATGTLLVFIVIQNIFQAVVQPRWKSVRHRLLQVLLDRAMWPLWKQWAKGKPTIEQREEILSSFAPISIASLMLVRITLLIFGFALLLYGLRHGISPTPHNLLNTIYMASVCVTTLGFGDMVAVSWQARLVSIIAAFSGVMIMALVISLVFVLHNYVHEREVPINLFVARSDGPPSGLSFLIAHARRNLFERLPADFAYWEIWTAQLVESHSAYPLLTYFRSSIPITSWVAALGAVLDAASLIISSVENVPAGNVQLFYDVACRAVPRLTKQFNLNCSEVTEIDRSTFENALTNLSTAGYQVRPADECWNAFRQARSAYIGHIRALANYYAIPPALWITD